jgi:hypothetical protein
MSVPHVRFRVFFECGSAAAKRQRSKWSPSGVWRHFPLTADPNFQI